MVRLGIPILLAVCLLASFPAFAGMPSRLHEFAQVADGGTDALWMQSSFLIVNQNLNDDAYVEIRFFDDAGVPMELKVEGSTTAVYPVTIPRKGSVKITTDGKGSALKVGSAAISASTEVGAQVFFQIYQGQTLITQAAIEPMGPMQSVDIFADYELTGNLATSSRTGYAITNLSTNSPLDIAIWLYPEDGSDPMWFHTLQLPARGHTARYLDEHFPSDKPFRGTARITAGGSFTLTALQAKGFLIGTLPPIRRPLYSRYGGQ